MKGLRECFFIMSVPAAGVDVYIYISPCHMPRSWSIRCMVYVKDVIFLAAFVRAAAFSIYHQFFHNRMLLDIAYIVTDKDDKRNRVSLPCYLIGENESTSAAAHSSYAASTSLSPGRQTISPSMT